MNAPNRNLDSGSLVTGSVLMVIGTLFLIDRFTSIEFSDMVRTWWPLTLIVIGVPKLARYATLWSGLWLIAVGTWLQLIQLDLFGITYRNSWPLLLIALGGGMVARAITDAAVRREEPNGF
jgi:hypothetical protein